MIRRFCLSVLAVSSLVAVAGAAVAGQAEDGFIAGYVTAVLERDFALADARVAVTDGVVRLREADLRGTDRTLVLSTVEAIRGVRRVEIEPAGTARQPSPPPSARPGRSVEAVTAPASQLLLPQRSLFSPLLADPRWPHFSAAYQNYLDSDELTHVGAVSFGETVGLYRSRLGSGAIQVGVQPGVFAVFDLGSDSQDLVNADYFIALPVSYRSGDFSAIARLFHQSSHLGDEFLLRRQPDRLNLSYEAFDFKLSYDLDSYRIYGGAGVLLRHDPDDLKPWSTQVGVEYRHPSRFWNDTLRPVAAVDLQNREESDWSSDVSLRAGVQLENPHLISQRIQLLLEYYNGHSPNGQFFEESIEYLGLGLHFYF